MWKCFIKNNYLYLVNGDKEYRRLKSSVCVRKKLMASTEYEFNDKNNTFLVVDISKLEDADSNAFTTETFDDFITANTGGSYSAGGSDRIYFRPAPTGSDLSYFTGDDYWKIINAADTYVVPENGVPMHLDPSDQNKLIPDNIFNNKFRYTGKTGGYYDHIAVGYYDSSGVATTEALAFPDNYIIDNHTGLGWHSIVDATTRTWEEALTYANALTISGFSDWYMPNMNELVSVGTFGESTCFAVIPFHNWASGIRWISTTFKPTPTLSWYTTNAGLHQKISKDNSYTYSTILMRYHFI